jgi:hypothetical protein
MLDISRTSFTPSVRLAVSKLAATGAFEWSSETLKELAGIYVSPKEIQRISENTGELLEESFQIYKDELFSETKTQNAFREVSAGACFPNNVMYIEYDGTGVPMTRRELAGRKGKQEDGGAKTREAKLGCIFTQTTVDAEGNPLRDKGSTSYFGAIETAEDFGERAYAHAVYRGLNNVGRTVVLGDGAKWIWNIADKHFPGAVQIVDLYHAKEHVFKIVRGICHTMDEVESLKERWFEALESGNVLAMLDEINSFANKRNDLSEFIRKETSYFKENAKRMRYDKFRALNLFVGSGVIEAGCKTVVGKRLKQSGMFWTVNGANAIIALRCDDLSGNNRFSLFHHQVD